MQFSLRIFWLLYTISIATCHIGDRNYLSRARMPESAYREGSRYADYKLLTDKMKLLSCKYITCADELSDILSNTQPENQETMSTMKLEHSSQGHKKNQWHNYPRQLDRLQSLYEASKKNNPEDSFRYEDKLPVYPFIDNTDHEQPATTRLQLLNRNSISDALVKKLPQANTLSRYLGLVDKRPVKKLPQANTLSRYLGLVDKRPVQKMLNALKKEMIYLNSDFDKVAADTREVSADGGLGLNFKLSNNNGLDAEPTITFQDDRDKSESVGLNEHINVSKRMFSLWSRMYWMKPNVRGVIHRKYFHVYNPPRWIRGDMLTAETRALARPDGSPLRFG